MERVTGIGGLFFRAKDPTKLAHWYRDNFGINAGVDGDFVWQQEQGPTVFAPFEADTDYFGRPDQQWMVNFRVRDLDAMLAQLKAAGAEVDEKVTVEDGVGRFGWVSDPEGNRIELWEPVDG
jgi:predicted enzyme related to lactoylglutathione lyase